MFAFRGPFPCVGSSEHTVRMESAGANLGPGPDRAGPGKPTLARLRLLGARASVCTCQNQGIAQEGQGEHVLGGCSHRVCSTMQGCLHLARARNTGVPWPPVSCEWKKLRQKWVVEEMRDRPGIQEGTPWLPGPLASHARDARGCPWSEAGQGEAAGPWLSELSGCGRRAQLLRCVDSRLLEAALLGNHHYHDCPHRYPRKPRLRVLGRAGI